MRFIKSPQRDPLPEVVCRWAYPLGLPRRAIKREESRLLPSWLRPLPRQPEPRGGGAWRPPLSALHVVLLPGSIGLAWEEVVAEQRNSISASVEKGGLRRKPR